MRINVLIMTFLLIVSTITPSYAENITGWERWDNKGTVTAYYDRIENKGKLFLANIDYSRGGQKRLYFSDIDIDSVLGYYRDDNTDTSYEALKELTHHSIIIFNGQAIKVSSQLDDSLGKYTYTYTPETDRGLNYIVSLFKKEVKPVKVEIGYNSFYVPVNGFTREWNKTSNNSF